MEQRLLFDVVYVDANAPASRPNGMSWDHAYRTLQQALGFNLATEIRIADGIYTPSTSDRSASFVMRNGVTIRGGYAGIGAQDPDARNVDATPTILSGDIGIVGDASDNSYHVIKSTDNDTTAILDGVMISGGRASGSEWSQLHGAGVEIMTTSSLQPGRPTFLGCKFQGNVASDGAAVYSYAYSEPIFTNCTFVGNRAQQHGGGIYAETGFIVTNCTLSGNTAAVGGAIYDLTSGSSLRNCILWDAGDRPGSQLNDGKTSAQFSNVQGGLTGTGNINVDPSFVRNPMPGPDRVWGTADDDFGDVHLQPFSKAADRGRTSLIPAGVTIDASGNPRSVDLPNVPNYPYGTVDMGAYEASPALLAHPGEAYLAGVGSSVTLNGKGASTTTGALQYAWEWSGDGRFDDAAGQTPVFPSATLPVGAVVTISLRITDAAMHTAVGSTTLTVIPAALYVDASATGAGNGTTWTDAFTTIDAALVAALPGQTIRVGADTYTPTTSFDRDATFWLKSGVALEGGYAGLDAANPDLRDITAFPTVLSGEIGSAADTDNSIHIVSGSGVSSTGRLDGFIITKGRADWSILDDESACGAGLYVNVGGPTIQNCTFIDNNADICAPGGAAFLNRDSTTFVGCTFDSNHATNGGAIYGRFSKLTVLNCSFENNDGGEGSGGAIALWGGTLTLTGSAFTGNTAGTCGGAIDIGPSTGGVIRDCAMTGNSAFFGGALSARSANTVACVNLMFIRNHATSGGAIYVSQASLTALNCKIFGNTAYDRGGGAFNDEDSSSYTNCVFSGNSATYGGGSYQDFSSNGPKFLGCTFTANSATQGSALYTNRFSAMTISNSIFWGNQSPTTQIFQSSSLTIANSDVEGGASGIGNIDINPKFARDANPGADGTWGTSDDDYGDLRLQLTSPCIDAGDNSLVPLAGMIDLACNPRIADAPNVRDYGAITDMGAYEWTPPIDYLFNSSKPKITASLGIDLDPATLDVSDLALLNVTSNLPLDFSAYASVSYDPITRTATWEFSRPLPDGDYRATVAAGSVKDTLGNGLPASLMGNLFALGGDANRDRKVDVGDLYILATNWNGAASTFSQGDFNYDGTVNAWDLAILSGNWQKTQAPPPAPAAPPSLPVAAARRTPVRVVKLIDV